MDIKNKKINSNQKVDSPQILEMFKDFRNEILENQKVFQNAVLGVFKDFRSEVSGTIAQFRVKNGKLI